MTITGQQIRQARRLLRKTTFWLARQTGIDYPQLVELQRSEGVSYVHTPALQSIRRVLEAAGVEFVAESDGAVGVRLRKIDKGEAN